MYRLGRSGQYQDKDAQSHIAYGHSALIHHLDQMHKTISVTRWALLGQCREQFFIKMKKLIMTMILLICYLFLLPSCTKTNSDENNRNVMLYFNGKTHSLFYNSDKKEFYFIQYLVQPKLEDEIIFSSIDATALTVSNHNKIIKFKIGDGNIFGISKLIGFEDKYLIKSNSNNLTEIRTWIPYQFNPIVFDDNFEEKIYCKCQDVKKSDSNCTSGGKGSTECSQSIGSPVVLTQSCNTKCDTKISYACCWSD